MTRFTLLLAVLLCLHCSTTQPVGTLIESNEIFNEPRTNFGRNSLGIWSPLTPFEVKVLTRDHDRYDEFLALALIGSGDSRTEEEFLVVKKRVWDFIVAVTPKIKKVKEFWRKGSILYHEVQKAFYPSVLGSKPMYSFNQTKLSTLVRKGEYNCISSAILFGIIAHHFGLNPQGVSVPSHAFLQISDPKTGTIIEVETTNAHGYNQVHDEAYYTSQESNWYSSRDLPPITYEDYLKRDIVSLKGLIIQNMSNQHARTRTMSLLDRMRLIEVKTHLDSKDIDHINTLIFMYQEETHRLITSDSATYLRFINTIRPTMTALADMPDCPSYFYDTYRWIVIEEARWFIGNNQHEYALDGLAEYIQHIPQADSNHAKMTRFKANYYYDALDSLTQQDRFTEALDFQNKYAHVCEEVEWCAKQMGWVYNTWIVQLWKKEEWKQVIDLYSDFEKQPYDSPLKETIATHKENAYKNWALKLIDTGDRSRAKNILKKCIKDIGDTPGCSDLLEKVS